MAASVSNVLALTLPAGMLWALGWWGGWQNSFHKGYEQAAVGPGVSVLGIALFVAAMCYVPMALTRQAVTGQWQAFWQWRTVVTLLRHSWLPTAALALLFAGLNMGAMTLKSWPYFAPQMRTSANPAPPAGTATPSPRTAPATAGIDWDQLTDAQALAHLNRHFLVSAVYVFGALLLLRSAAARIYAGAMLRCVQSGALRGEQLAENERLLLQRLQLHPTRARPPRPSWNRVLAFTASGTAAALGMLATVLLWLGFVAQIYVSEFLQFHPVIGWLNQPLVQLPWFRYVPPHLQDPSGELALTALVLLLFGLALRLRPKRPAERPRRCDDDARASG